MTAPPDQLPGDQIPGDPDVDCARCGRIAPRSLMSPWRERERYRRFVGRAGPDATPDQNPVRYVYEYKEHLVCPSCRAALDGGGRTGDLAQRRTLVIIAVVVALAALAALLAPVVMPQLLSAFWRT